MSWFLTSLEARIESFSNGNISNRKTLALSTSMELPIYFVSHAFQNYLCYFLPKQYRNWDRTGTLGQNYGRNLLPKGKMVGFRAHSKGH